MKLNQGKKKAVVVALLVIATLLLSLLPEAEIENITHTEYNYYTDLLQHSSYYLVLMLATCWMFQDSAPWKIGLLLFGLSLGVEIGQHFMPNRTFSIHDIFSNITGITVAMVFVAASRHLRRKTTIPQNR